MAAEIELLLGRIVERIEVGNEDIWFHCNNYRSFRMFHAQDCCESVNIEEIIGDINDLVGSPIVLAEERSQNDPNASESGTWTFYEIGSAKGTVTIRWYGASNGYYSESVSFAEIS
jgi:hypothetical protein